MGPYLPLVLMFALAAGFALFSVTAAPYVGPRRYNRAKLDAYECGIEPSPHPVLMKFVLKLLANLTEPRGGDATDRIINALARIAPAA